MLKRILVTVAIIGVTAASYGQGTVFFDNNQGAGVARVFDVDGTTPLSGAAYSAQLYSAPGLNQPEGSLTAAETRVQFRTGLSNAGYVPTATTTINTFTTQAVDPVVTVTPTEGGPATIQMRAWDSAFPTYEAARDGNGKIGKSNLLSLPTGGGLTPPLNLTGLQSFQLTQVPEPSTFALAALGLGALLFRRRK